jgi:hypothetical protein
MEVGAQVSKIAHPSVLQFVEAQISTAPKPTAFLITRQNLLIRIWPEHWGTFFHRILPSSFDPAH